MTKIKSIFDWVTIMQVSKEPWSSFSNEDHEIFSNFMINKIMSMNPEIIEVVAEIQEYNIPKERLYNFYCQVLPKRKSWSKYIKSSKAMYSNEVLEILAGYYQVSTREVLDYCQIISKDEVIEILLQTGVQEKEIKKMLK
jgi:hypothetical protein